MLTQEQMNWIFSYIFLVLLLFVMAMIFWLFGFWGRGLCTVFLVLWAHHASYTWERPFPKNRKTYDDRTGRPN